jgi:orotidine-5'-phosphate decarboxylase
MNASALAVANTGSRPVPSDMRERLIVALDVPDEQTALEFMSKLEDTVLFYKVGLQLLFGGGLKIAEKLVREGKRVFLDSKIWDIDKSVEKAVADVAKMGVDFVTVHGNGSAIRAAIKGRGSYLLKIFSVTVLTSLDAHDMADLGFESKFSIPEIVLKRAQSALDAGCDGVIASGLEAADIRAMAGKRLLIVTPGIRSVGIPHHDQKRVSTPGYAIASGADYIVIGRQIIESPDPRIMAESILQEMRDALP